MATVGFTRTVIAAVCVLGLSACAQNSAENAALGINDPYEGTNRDIHDFNKGVDRYVVRPVSEAYGYVTPGLVRLLVRNALNHLELPRDFANHVLTGEFAAAGRTLGRFGINTFIGAGGLLDPATDFDLPKEDADFGRTLAKAGSGEGVYYEIPLIGPSTVRHTVGRVVDIAFAPTTYIGAPLTGAVAGGLDLAETRESNKDAIDSVLYESVDSYSTARSIYLQNRRRFVNDGKVDRSLEPDLFDEESSQ